MVASGVCAQQKVGTFAITPKTGVTVSNFSGHIPTNLVFVVGPATPPTYNQLNEYTDPFVKLLSVSFDDKKSKVNFTIGVEGQYQFNKTFGLSLGVFYAQGGTRYKTKGYSFKTDDVKISMKNDLTAHFDCITLPLLANVYVWKGLSLKAGLQPEFAINTKTKGDISMEYDGQTTHVSSLGDSPVKSFSLSLPVGLGYEWKNVVADFRYGFGLTNIHKGNDLGGYSKARNSVFSFTLGYKFQL
ncbi:MAG: PorT family protein [Prevotella sp.]|nr:PorT family protein [Prevotella sp.]